MLRNHFKKPSKRFAVRAECGTKVVENVTYHRAMLVADECRELDSSHGVKPLNYFVVDQHTGRAVSEVWGFNYG